MAERRPGSLMPPAAEILDVMPAEAVSLLSQFMSGELDSYEFMPLIVNLRKQTEKAKLARMDV